MLLPNMMTIGAKLEATAYTAETLVAADYDFQADGIQYGHEMNEYKRKYATGTLSQDISIIGKQSGSVSFYVDLAGMTSVNTAGPYSKLLQACGAKETVISTTGVKWEPSSELTQKPITIEIVERSEGATPVQLVITLAGCMGNCKLVLNQVGEPVRMEFEFKGRLQSIADRAFASIIVPALVTTATTARVLSATLTHGGVAQDIDKMTLDFGNDVQPIVDPSNATGIKGFQIVGRDPTLELDPSMKLLATEAWYTQWKASTTGAFSCAFSATPLLTISAPKAQYIENGPEERNNYRVLKKKFGLKKNTAAGEDEWKLLQGA